MISLPHQKYQIGQCIVNCHDMTISKGALKLTLPAKVFEFLKLLVLHAGETVTKETAIEQVWLGNIEVGKRGTGNAIWQLRKTISELGEEPEAYFKTITKVGYQLLVTPKAVEAPSQSLSQETQPISSTQKPLIKAIVFAVFLLILMLGGYQFYPFTSEVKQEVLVTPERITNFEGVEEQAAISPDGRFMAFQWRRDQKKAQIYIKDLSDDTAPLRQVSMSEDKETSPTWSPDGQALAYFRFNSSGECELHVRELITNQDRLLDTGCMSRGYLSSLDWSPDGQSLAYAKSLSDRVAVFSYELHSNKITQLTMPQIGEEDLLVSWSADSKKLAVVRAVELSARVLIHSLVDDTALEVISGESMIISLEWEHENNLLYFNALREGNFVIERYSFATQSVQDFHRDDTISSLVINDTTQSLYYSRHISQEHITLRSLADGRILRQLASSSRDMFGQQFVSTGELLFLSNRSGSWELWLKQRNGSKQLTAKQGLVGVPAASPVDDRYALPLKPVGADHYMLYVGSLSANQLNVVPQALGDIRNPSFSLDGRKIYYSSNVEGKWEIYQYEVDTQKVKRIVEEGGKYAVEDNLGGLYYSKDNTPGLFYQPKVGNEVLVTEELAVGDWGSFFYQEQAVYFLKRSDSQDILVRLDSQWQPEIVFSLPAVSIRGGRSLAKAADGALVVSMLGINDADIYRISLEDSHRL